MSEKRGCWGNYNSQAFYLYNTSVFTKLTDPTNCKTKYFAAQILKSVIMCVTSLLYDLQSICLSKDLLGGIPGVSLWAYYFYNIHWWSYLIRTTHKTMPEVWESFKHCSLNLSKILTHLRRKCLEQFCFNVSCEFQSCRIQWNSYSKREVRENACVLPLGF